MLLYYFRLFSSFIFSLFGFRFFFAPCIMTFIGGLRQVHYIVTMIMMTFAYMAGTLCGINFVPSFRVINR